MENISSRCTKNYTTDYAESVALGKFNNSKSLEAFMSAREEEDALIERLNDEDWRSQGIAMILDGKEPCPLRAISPSGVAYCIDSALSTGRCRFNGSGEVLVTAEEMPEYLRVSSEWKTEDARAQAAFHREVTSQNVCTYKLPGEAETKLPLLS